MPGAAYIHGLHVLQVVSDFQLRVSAWNLKTRAVTHLKGAKCAQHGVCFHAKGHLMATLEVGKAAPVARLTARGAALTYSPASCTKPDSLHVSAARQRVAEH